MLKQKLKTHGFIFSDKYTASSAYLLDDGTFLNLQNQPPLYKKNYVSHMQLDMYINEHNLLKGTLYKKYSKDNPKLCPIRGGDRILLYTDNACVLNNGEFAPFESFFLELPPKMPAGKQLEQLIIWLDDLHYKKRKSQLDINLKTNLVSIDIKSTTTDDIIKEIKKLYNKSYNNNDSRKE